MTSEASEAAPSDEGESYVFYPARDLDGRPCWVSFTPEELGANPELTSDPEVRQKYLDAVVRRSSRLEPEQSSGAAPVFRERPQLGEKVI